MKRLFYLIVAPLLLIALFNIANARDQSGIYYLYLGSTDSGSTPVASGVSTMVIDGKGQRRSSGVTYLKVGDTNGIMTLQLDPRFGPTVATDTGGDQSGLTFEVRAKASIIDRSDIWAGASVYTTTFVLGGTSTQVVLLELDQWADKISFDYLSGITPLSQVRVIYAVK